jgi:two-component system NtrC family sensor kinase
MSDLGALALRLSEATDVPTAAERLAEHLRTLVEGAAARVYLLGPADRCGTCARAAECTTRDRCLHLEGSLGRFARPIMLDQRIPRTEAPWGALLEGSATPGAFDVPDELTGDRAEAARAVLVPMEAGGETVGVIALRLPDDSFDEEEILREVTVAAFLTATAVRLMRTLGTANRRFEQLLLVNELGRKVNSILNDDLLLRQAAMDIHSTFGFHNVMIFMVDDTRSTLELRAQASSYASPQLVQDRVAVSEGVIGRVFQTGTTEVIEDVDNASGYVRWYADTKSELAVAIQVGGVIEGVLNVESDQTSGFTPSDRLVLETVANQMAIAIENARLFGMVKEREDRYRTLVESSPGAVFQVDAAGRLIYANPAAARVTGHDKRRLLSRFRSVPDLAIQEDRATLQKAIDDALRGESRRDLEFHIEHADGGLRFLRAWLEPHLSEQGDAKGVVILARDQTRERQLQDQLNQSEKLSAIGTLVSGVAHELNNPLAGILGFAQLMQSRPPEEWSHKDLEMIEKSATRCQKIVENLLAFARQGRINKRRADINEIIGGVLDLNDYQFRMDNIEIERDFDSEIPSFPVDVHRWQQVFINLASNAHQAMAATVGSDRRIRFTTRRKESEVEIRISDNGPGIPKEKRKHIFDPFFTTKATGTGLGLGICFGIVEEHGGSITLDEAAEVGATFLIRLPIAENTDIDLPVPTGPRLAASEIGADKTVLVVDDDEYVRDVVERILRNHGYETVVAASGDEALRTLATRDFDLMITDVRMPGEYDGIDLHDRLVAHDPASIERMLFMTGNLMDGRTMERLKGVQVPCVEKPFDIHHLASLINEVAASATQAARLHLPAAQADAQAG